MWNTQGAPASAGSQKVEPWPPPPRTPWTAGPSLPAGGPPVLHPGAPRGAQKTPPETVTSSAHPPVSVRRETPQRSRGRVPEPVMRAGEKPPRLRVQPPQRGHQEEVAPEGATVKHKVNDF